jgi:hypothetical protein
VDDEGPSSPQSAALPFEPQAIDRHSKRQQGASAGTDPSTGRIGADGEVYLARIEPGLDPSRDQGSKEIGLAFARGGDDAGIENTHESHLELRLE